MDIASHKLEAELEALLPQALDEALTERLMAAIGHPAVGLEAGLVPVEEKLRRMAPLPIPAGLGDRLAATLERTPFRADEKLVLFPRGAASQPASARRRQWTAAAAAVAFAGAISALWISPQDAGDGGFAGSPPAAAPAAPAEVGPAGAFVPASFGSEVRETRDMGVRWNREAEPMRVLKVVFTDRIAFRNAKGETFEAEVPRVEYILAPEKVD